ncbi:alpha/beta fold hydrolase [Hyalangium gracile]|uniref:alpha/beta fold hydrolase n=1 Tax=Hyalangium gracile TaxID=394092 RepID=UPI001CCB32F9|nr:alpha/beta hydrolase [Hyalangium gracile]
MPIAAIHGQDIFYEDSGGPGRPIILGHGFLMDSRMFEAQVRALAPEFRVIRWDSRGTGRTRWDGKPFSLWDSADDCVGLLDHLGIERAVVGGMSLGSHCALRVALRYPERVKGLVLMSTRITQEDAQQQDIYRDIAKIWSSEGPIEPILHILANSFLGDPFRFTAWTNRWRVLTGAHVLATIRCLYERDDISKRLKDIRCPALVVHGAQDTTVSPSQGELLSHLLPGSAGCVFIPEAAHAVCLTHPELLNPHLLEFLRAHA